MYEKANNICEDKSMLEGYVYSCYRYLAADEYQKMVMGNDVFLQIDNEMAEKISKVNNELDICATKDELEEWKKEYRRE